jgi:UDP-N-acetylmuramoyl-tripeptide--D-alanyl-D-alanine ligase
VSIDSRTIKPGDLFIALSGPSFDGHGFVADALDKGAAAAVVAATPRDIAADAPLLQVNNTESALASLARRARDRSSARRICVTGSVGKTSTKDALAAALRPQGLTHATEGNLNNQIGAPLTLSRMTADTKFAVIELGINHPGELTELSALCRPHVAIITAIAPAHLEFFSSVTDISIAKAEIFSGLEPGGTAILNRDDAQFALIYEIATQAAERRVVSFGCHSEADVKAVKISADGSGSTISAQIHGRPVKYRVGSPGRHWVMNSLAVLAAVEAAGGDAETAAQVFETMSAAPGRGQALNIDLNNSVGQFLLIDDSYNANPASMRAAFETLSVATPSDGGRRIAVLGDMLELGDKAPALHKSLSCGLHRARADLVFCAGPLMASLYEELPEEMRGALAQSAEDLAPILEENIRVGDVVLVKGSLGSRMATIVEALKQNARAPYAAEAPGA